MRTKALTDKQLKMLFKVLPPRDVLICKIIRQTGLRISDVLALKKADIAPKMTVLERKTKKKRTITLTKALVRDCAIYGATHRGMRLFNCNRSTFYRSLHRAALKFGWQNVSAHSIRKTYARAYCRKYGVEATRRELRHDSVATTLIYLQDL